MTTTNHDPLRTAALACYRRAAAHAVSARVTLARTEGSLTLRATRAAAADRLRTARAARVECLRLIVGAAR